MLENLISKSNSAAPSRALVCGGFHAPQIAALLKQQKISFIVVSPKISKVDTASGSTYLSVFAREKTPLDKLFQGEKLFVCPTQVNIPDDELALRIVN